mmetsp:Transcript_3961/g.11023  ORF Transcript_3961/g.11023 Transcript_3961/m.11023 type:complete len:162 (-) Transcript_3961:53-538(-)
MLSLLGAGVFHLMSVACLLATVLPGASVSLRSALAAPAPPAESLLHEPINISTPVGNFSAARRTNSTVAPPYSENATARAVPKVQPPENVSAQEHRTPLDVDCEMGQWTDWGDCVSVFNDGLRSKFQFRDRVAVTPPRGNGAPCSDTTTQRTCIGAEPLLR